MISIREKKYIYESVIDDIKSKIDGGVYLPGDRLDSISEMQKEYAIGRNTAIRIIEELEKSGVAVRKKGKGTFVNTLLSINGGEKKVEPIEKIILYLNSVKVGAESFAGKIFEGIYERIEELKIDFRMECKNFDPAENQKNYLPFKINENEGLITLFIYNQPNLLLQQLLAGFSFRCILVDGVFPGAHSVLTDNYQGMYDLISYLEKLGHRKITFVEPNISTGFYFNVNERREAFLRITKEKNLDASILKPSGYEEIYQICKSKNRPSALIYYAGEPAANCIDYCIDKGISVPDDISICSFGNWLSTGKSAEGLTAVRENCFELGKRAVDLLVTPDLSSNIMSDWKRVAPKMISGNTVKKLKKKDKK